VALYTGNDETAKVLPRYRSGLDAIQRTEAVKEARFHGTLAGNVRIEWPRPIGLGKTGLGSELSRMEEAIQLDSATSVLRVEGVPDEIWSAVQFQPSERPSTDAVQLATGLRKLG
jgi:hypothetical protein